MTDLFFGLAILLSCSGPHDPPNSDQTTPVATEDGTPSVPTTEVTTPCTAETGQPTTFPTDLRLSKITLMQAVETVLVEDGVVPTAPAARMVARRPTMLRVWVDLDDDFDSRELSLVVELNGALEETVSMTPIVDSTVENLETTFVIDEIVFQPDDVMTVTIVETDAARGGSEPDEVQWTSDALPIMETGPMELHLIPVQYDADGSSRLPDLGANMVDIYTRRLESMFPMEELTVQVGDPFVWPGPVHADGRGWSQLLDAIQQLRTDAIGLVGPNAYFYAVVDPADTFVDYCVVAGCRTAQSSGNGPVPDEVGTHAAAGIGFPGSDWETTPADNMIHELGHIHGRNHAPCGNPRNVDPDYPVLTGTLDGWGWDSWHQELMEPDEYGDIMSWCEPAWMSAYTWEHLADRMRYVLGDGPPAPSRVPSSGCAAVRSPNGSSWYETLP